MVTRAAVRCDGRRLAVLRWAGRQVTVVDENGGTVGRWFPAGYLRGRPDDGSGLVDLYTARHPSVHTPSDQLLAEGLTVEAAARLLLAEYSFSCYCILSNESLT